jgi:hypothetical protein
MNRQYGIFSISLNCFLLASNDVWLIMHTAKLVDSKISVCVCDLGAFIDTQQSPENWTVTNLSEITFQPILHKIPSGIEQYHCNSANLKKSKEMIEHIYKITKSAWLTDATLNTANHSLFLSLLDEKNFSRLNDSAGTDIEFLKKIDAILYQSQSVEEIDKRINDFFKNTYSLRPHMLHVYKKIFFDMLNNEN